jgi:hypothetical protein
VLINVERKQQEIEANTTYVEQEEEDITKEENYMKNLGNFRNIKLEEDQFRVKFLERKPGFSSYLCLLIFSR